MSSEKQDLFFKVAERRDSIKRILSELEDDTDIAMVQCEDSGHSLRLLFSDSIKRILSELEDDTDIAMVQCEDSGQRPMKRMKTSLEHSESELKILRKGLKEQLNLDTGGSGTAVRMMKHLENLSIGGFVHSEVPSLLAKGIKVRGGID